MSRTPSSNRFITGANEPIEIGREIGRGGEGSVYEVPANRQWVAKLYNAHHLPDKPKQAKLRFMAAAADAALLKYAAWPEKTLQKTPDGATIGFLMPRIMGQMPIHMLYNPEYRRENYPKAGWDFLLFVARNTAAAFAEIHQHGHVVGDVNQGNVLVAADSRVVLIDTDSFQINANGTVYLCEVGVAHFTPPELQGVASFDHAPRTANHDNFGLALLIFHLLFGGRHPYSGVPLRADAGQALEKDIEAYRYAYAPDGQRRGFKPPPQSIPITLVPDAIQALFTTAFTEQGAREKRPTAQEWVAALDDLRQHIQQCAVTAMHAYPDHLTRCPWCALEKQGMVYFLHPGVRLVKKARLAQATARFGKIFAKTPRQTAPSVLTYPANVPGRSSIWQGFAIAAIIVVVIPLVIFGINKPAPAPDPAFTLGPAPACGSTYALVTLDSIRRSFESSEAPEKKHSIGFSHYAEIAYDKENLTRACKTDFILDGKETGEQMGYTIKPYKNGDFTLEKIPVEILLARYTGPALDKTLGQPLGREAIRTAIIVGLYKIDEDSRQSSSFRQLEKQNNLASETARVSGIVPTGNCYSLDVNLFVCPVQFEYRDLLLTVFRGRLGSPIRLVQAEFIFERDGKSWKTTDEFPQTFYKASGLMDSVKKVRKALGHDKSDTDGGK